jgi:hypothetical protein
MSRTYILALAAIAALATSNLVVSDAAAASSGPSHRKVGTVCGPYDFTQCPPRLGTPSGSGVSRIVCCVRSRKPSGKENPSAIQEL